MKIPLSKIRAFTIIELLIVIAIIAILSAIIITNLAGSRAKSRDAKRVSDVAQLQLAVEQFFDRCQKYPTAASSGGLDIAATCLTSSGNTITLGDYISQIIPPPGGTTQTYYDYVTNTTRTDYVIHAIFEGSTEVIKDGLKAFPSGGTWPTPNPPITCANDVTSRDYCVGPK